MFGRDRIDDDFNTVRKRAHKLTQLLSKTPICHPIFSPAILFISFFFSPPYLHSCQSLGHGAACAAGWGHPPTLTQPHRTPTALARLSCSPVGAAGLVRLIGRPLVRRGFYTVARSGLPVKAARGSLLGATAAIVILNFSERVVS